MLILKNKGPANEIPKPFYDIWGKVATILTKSTLRFSDYAADREKLWFVIIQDKS